MVYWGTHGGGGGKVFQAGRCETEEKWGEFEFGSAEFVMSEDDDNEMVR